MGTWRRHQSLQTCWLCPLVCPRVQVEVFNTATQKSYFFPCNDWLRKTKEQGEKSCRKELLAGEPWNRALPHTPLPTSVVIA